MSDHLIDKQVYNLNIKDHSSQQLIHNKISNHVNPKLLELLSRLFDEYFPDDEVVEIDTINLDLGELSLQNLEEDLLQRVEVTLRSEFDKIKNLLPTGAYQDKRKKIEVHQWELWERFMVTGIVPIDALSDGFDVRLLFQKFQEKDPEGLKRFFSMHISSPFIIKRLLHQIGRELLLQYIEVEGPSRVTRESLKRRLALFFKNIGRGRQQIAASKQEEVFILAMLMVTFSMPKTKPVTNSGPLGDFWESTILKYKDHVLSPLQIDERVIRAFDEVFSRGTEEKIPQPKKGGAFAAVLLTTSIIERRKKIKKIAKAWQENDQFDVHEIGKNWNSQTGQYWFESLDVTGKDTFIEKVFRKGTNPFRQQRAEILLGLRRLFYRNFRIDLFRLAEMDKFLGVFFDEKISLSDAVAQFVKVLMVAQDRGVIAPERLKLFISGEAELEITSMPRRERVIDFWTRVSEEILPQTKEFQGPRSELEALLYFLEFGLLWSELPSGKLITGVRELYDELKAIRSEILIESIWKKMDLYFVRHRLAYQLRHDQLRVLTRELIRRYRNGSAPLMIINEYLRQVENINLPNSFMNKWYALYLDVVWEVEIDKERVETLFSDLAEAVEGLNADAITQISHLLKQLADDLELSPNSQTSIEIVPRFQSIELGEIEFFELISAFESGGLSFRVLEEYILSKPSGLIEELVFELNKDPFETWSKEGLFSTEFILGVVNRLRPDFIHQVIEMLSLIPHLEIRINNKVKRAEDRILIGLFRLGIVQGGLPSSKELTDYLSTFLSELLGTSDPKIEASYDFGQFKIPSGPLSGKSRVKVLANLKAVRVRNAFLQGFLATMLPEETEMLEQFKKPLKQGVLNQYEVDEELRLFYEEFLDEFAPIWSMSYSTKRDLFNAFDPVFWLIYKGANTERKLGLFLTEVTRKSNLDPSRVHVGLIHLLSRGLNLTNKNASILKGLSGFFKQESVRWSIVSSVVWRKVLMTDKVWELFIELSRGDSLLKSVLIAAFNDFKDDFSNEIQLKIKASLFENKDQRSLRTPRSIDGEFARGTEGSVFEQVYYGRTHWTHNELLLEMVKQSKIGELLTLEMFYQFKSNNWGYLFNRLKADIKTLKSDPFKFVAVIVEMLSEGSIKGELFLTKLREVKVADGDRILQLTNKNYLFVLSALIDWFMEPKEESASFEMHKKKLAYLHDHLYELLKEVKVAVPVRKRVVELIQEQLPQVVWSKEPKTLEAHFETSEPSGGTVLAAKDELSFIDQDLLPVFVATYFNSFKELIIAYFNGREPSHLTYDLTAYLNRQLIQHKEPVLEYILRHISFIKSNPRAFVSKLLQIPVGIDVVDERIRPVKFEQLLVFKKRLIEFQNSQKDQDNGFVHRSFRIEERIIEVLEKINEASVLYKDAAFVVQEIVKRLFDRFLVEKTRLEGSDHEGLEKSIAQLESVVEASPWPEGLKQILAPLKLEIGLMSSPDFVTDQTESRQSQFYGFEDHDELIGSVESLLSIISSGNLEVNIPVSRLSLLVKRGVTKDLREFTTHKVFDEESAVKRLAAIIYQIGIDRVVQWADISTARKQPFVVILQLLDQLSVHKNIDSSKLEIEMKLSSAFVSVLLGRKEAGAVELLRMLLAIPTVSFEQLKEPFMRQESLLIQADIEKQVRGVFNPESALKEQLHVHADLQLHVLFILTGKTTWWASNFKPTKTTWKKVFNRIETDHVSKQWLKELLGSEAELLRGILVQADDVAFAPLSLLIDEQRGGFAITVNQLVESYLSDKARVKKKKHLTEVRARLLTMLLNVNAPSGSRIIEFAVQTLSQLLDRHISAIREELLSNAQVLVDRGQSRFAVIVSLLEPKIDFSGETKGMVPPSESSISKEYDRQDKAGRLLTDLYLGDDFRFVEALKSFTKTRTIPITNHWSLVGKKDFEDKLNSWLTSYPDEAVQILDEIFSDKSVLNQTGRKHEFVFFERLHSAYFESDAGFILSLIELLVQLPSIKSKADFRRFYHWILPDIVALKKRQSTASIAVNVLIPLVIKKIMNRYNLSFDQLLMELEGVEFPGLRVLQFDLIAHIKRFPDYQKGVLAKKEEKKEVIKEKKIDLEELPPAPRIEEGVEINNAGMVLLGPFIVRYLDRLELTHKKQFKTQEDAMRGAGALQYLISGKSEAFEYDMLLNKIICGIPVNVPLPHELDLTEEEKALADSLLKAVIQNWEKMKGSSIEALRETFLQRSGKLIERDAIWELQVEKTTVDILLDSLSWTYTMIKLPWMEKRLVVIWE